LKRHRGAQRRRGKHLRPDLEKRGRAAELRAQGLTTAEIARRLGISRQGVCHLLRDPDKPTGPASIPWTQSELRLLGKMPDAELAEWCGRTVAAVSVKRHRLKIREFQSPHWTPEDMALLGAMPDVEVAQKTGRTLNAVGQRRRKLGIPMFPGE
jgi:hypothetical protein